jgi:tripartite ATP-independent transporter DctM subunit
MELLGILILVGVFILLLILGVPIVYSIGLATLATMLVNILPVPAVTTLAQRMATGLDSFALLAIPFFVLAGLLMNRGGIASRLIDFAKVLVGTLPGGLAYVNVVAAMLFGAISGSAVAAASAIGGIMGPRMEAEGYGKSFGAALNVTSATTGLIIPPSNIMIVYSLASGGTSIAALFLAGYVPGFLVGIFLIIISGYMAFKNKYPVGERLKLTQALKKFVDAIPSLFLIVVVIGGIIAGIFTPTEASAIAVFYAFVLSVFVYREVKWREVPTILLESVMTTGVVMFLIGASIGMSWVMSFENIPQMVTSSLLTLSSNPIIILFIINLILLFIGMFMDMTPAVLIFTPIFLPVVTNLGMDPVHFGVIMVTNLCVGLCTPPVGSVLFVGCSVAKISIEEITRPLLPFFISIMIALVLIIVFPNLSLWLPRMFGL